MLNSPRLPIVVPLAAIGTMVRLLALLWLASTAVTARPATRRDLLGLELNLNLLGLDLDFELSTPKKFHDPSPDTVVGNLLELTSAKGSLSASYTNPTRKPYGTASISQLFDGQVFLTEIEWGGKKHAVVLDTGSSDTWLVEKGFRCVDLGDGTPVPEAECMFGAPWTRDNTFKQIPNQVFNVSYGDGQFAAGIMGNQTVKLAGITVENQEVASVNHAGWFGDEVSTGIVGLAFPSITSAYSGTDPKKASLKNQVIYNPIFTNMYEKGTVAPVFSIAIKRGNDTGTLAIGGIPPVTITPPFASTPFQYLTVKGKTSPQYQFYTVKMTPTVNTPSGSILSPILSPILGLLSTKAKQQPLQAIVDTGTTLIYLPTAMSKSINALFSPPAKYSEDDGVYFIKCSAKVPDVTITIGGVDFKVDKRDLVLDTGDGRCVSGIADAHNPYATLGVVFLKSVLAVFDVGAGVMRFARHVY